MPRFASEDDKTAAKAIERWKLLAASEVEDIGAWRQDAAKRALHGDWPEEPNLFFTRTSYLCGWIRRHHPTIDPAPLEAVYLASKRWHADRNAKRIPAQASLDDTLELAIMRLQSVEQAIMARVVETGGDGIHLPGGPAGTGPMKGRWTMGTPKTPRKVLERLRELHKTWQGLCPTDRSDAWLESHREPAIRALDLMAANLDLIKKCREKYEGCPDLGEKVQAIEAWRGIEPSGKTQGFAVALFALEPHPGVVNRHSWRVQLETWIAKYESAGARARPHRRRHQRPKPPLTKNADAVLSFLKKLPKGRAMTGPDILNALVRRNPPVILDQSTLTKNVIPTLKKHYGVKNKPRVGYYIPAKG